MGSKRKIHRAVIVGCGQIAGGYDEKSGGRHVFTHAGAYSKHSRFRLEAAADPDARRLAAFRRHWKVPGGHADYRAMLRGENPDIVSVCVPDALHRRVVLDCLEFSDAKAILLEKPIALNYTEAAATVDACRKRGVSLIVNYTRLWEPVHAKVRDLIASGYLGTVQAVTGYYVRGLLHNGTTLISTLRYLLSSQVREVQALGSAAKGSKGDPSLDGRMVFADGTGATLIAADKGGYGHSIFEIDLMGSAGRLVLRDNGFRLEAFRTAPYRRYPGVRELVADGRMKIPVSGMDRTLLATLDEAAEALDGMEPSLGRARAAAWDIRIAEALMESARSGGKRVKLPRERTE